jgi:Cu(I)/Ag(I) efflux system membrane fusion protein
MKAKNKWIYAALFAAGLLAGWLLFGRPAGHDHAPETVAQVWTCSMHPQIRQEKPGKCPLCAMNLIPLQTMPGSSDTADPDAITLSLEAVALANIRTAIALRRAPVKDIRLFGTVQPNERLVRSQVSHVAGRIEQLQINFTGETVRAGQVIAGIYSPDLLNAQQELLETVRIKDLQPALLEAAREKLRLWKLTDAQIAAVEQSGEASPTVDVVAQNSGVVIAKNVEQGDYVAQGGLLFTLADLSSVWLLFDAYESDLPYLRTGLPVEYTLQAFPGKTFSGKIAFIDPVLDKTTRTARIRVEAPNPGLLFKPEMYAQALVRATLGRGDDALVIPKTAVLWTGRRSIVYVKQPDAALPSFRLREIELGPLLGDSYVVRSGLDDGEEIVGNGVFTVDAAAQLEGKRSMMNDLATSAADHPRDAAAGSQARMAVNGLCEMCKERIEDAAKSLSGVSAAAWDAHSRQLQVTFDPLQTTADAIARTVARAGHDTDQYKADDKTYEALPDCCKYRKQLSVPYL